MQAYSVNQRAVRRFLLESQALLPHQSEELHNQDDALSMVRRLECVQLDPVSVVERNQHLALSARVPGYEPKHLNQLLKDGHVFEYIANAACVIPIEDYPLLKPIREHKQNQLQVPLQPLEQVVESVLHRLETEGPLPSRVFKSETRVHGYWDNKDAKTKETSLALNLLLDSGIIRVVCREGSERFFDLTERTIPAKVLQEAKAIEIPEASSLLLEKYMRAYRVFDHHDARLGWQKMTASDRKSAIEERVRKGNVVPLQIDEVKRQYYILAKDLPKLEAHSEATKREEAPIKGAIRFLPPLDNLLWRRDRLEDLFDFYYKWEIYIPKAKRRYGPYAMPILYGDRLIGRINPRIDRKENRLTISLLQLEPHVEITSHLCNQLEKTLKSFADFHQARDIVIEETEPSGLDVRL